MLRALTVVATVAYVSAQSISTGCTSALSSIAVNADAATCLNPVALVPLVSGNTSESVIPTIDNWLKGLCSAAPCSNATIAAVTTNITLGCSNDLFGSPASQEDLPSIIPSIQLYYPIVREVLCLKDGSENCITKTLKSIEAATGTLNFQNIAKLVASPPVELLTANLTCTDCTKAAFNVIAKSIPAESTAQLKPTIQSQCGASFVDGANPANIVQTATQTGSSGSTTTPGTSSATGALYSLSKTNLLGLAVSGAMTVSAALFL